MCNIALSDSAFFKSFLARGCEKVQQVLEFAAKVNFGNVIRGKVAPAVLVPTNRTGEIICEHWDGDNMKDCGNCPGASNTALFHSLHIVLILIVVAIK